MAQSSDPYQSRKRGGRTKIRMFGLSVPLWIEIPYELATLLMFLRDIIWTTGTMILLFLEVLIPNL